MNPPPADSLFSAKDASRIGFGAPDVRGAHLFRVEIPRSNRERILIVEQFGYSGGHGGVPEEEPRVLLDRSIWNGIRDAARREFNARLKVARQPVGKWSVGSVLVDRILGKELCVLAWAAEAADLDVLPILCARWAALRPEERWWLFSMTAAEAGLPEDRDRGWRKALQTALTDAEAKAHRRVRPREEGGTSLFGDTK